MKNIRISEKADEKLEQGGNALLWYPVAFVLLVWLCRDVTQDDSFHARPVNGEVNVLHSLGLI